jgi:hypothetical protein
MDLPESNVHSFIVKLWLEEAGEDAGVARWHGYVTHVPSGERRYLQELRDVLSFIRPYVAEIGASEIGAEVTRSWLRSWKRRKR